METRPYQKQALNNILEAYQAGVRRQAVVMATGTGKTAIFSQIPYILKGQTLVVAHTEDLVKQNAVRLQDFNPSLTVGVEMAGTYADTTVDIVSASVQTLGRAGTKRLERFSWEKFNTIIIDECHHATSESYRRIFDKTGCLQPDSTKLLLGTTATIQRTDGVNLSEIFERITFCYPIRQAIKDGWLVDIKGYRVRTETSLTGLSKSEGDFSKGELSQRVNSPQRNQQVVDAYQRVGEKRKAVCYCVDIQHAQAVAEEFGRAGIAAEAMWGEDPRRTDKLERHRRGTTTVLCVVGLLIEGYDDPSIACVILSRPTQSPILLPQMVGRGTRLEDGINLLDKDPYDRVKRNLIVIYIVDGKPEPTLITLPTLMGLSNNLDIHGASLLKAAEYIENLQEENPNVDFSKLERLDGAKLLIEQVDMFQVRFPQEVQENSELTWYKSATGGYKMLIPKEGAEGTGVVRVYENTLGQWELDGKIKGDEFHGIRASFEEAIKVTDEQIRKRVSKQTLSYISREAKWKTKPVTRGQIKMLARLFPHKTFAFDQMSSGQASHLIAERLTKK